VRHTHRRAAALVRDLLKRDLVRTISKRRYQSYLALLKQQQQLHHQQFE
jgi:hypothetical protein